MEAVIYTSAIKGRWIIWALLGMALLALIPATMALANALTDPTIGMSGVNDSSLTVARSANDRSSLLIEWGNNGHINPSSISYPLAVSVPLIFLVLAILLAMGMVFGEGFNIKGLILVGILIVTALALLFGIVAQTSGLLGG